jgi:hypothetical protein
MHGAETWDVAPTATTEMTIGGFSDFGLVMLAVLACAMLAGCRPTGTGRALVVVASGDTAGWIVPCGCTSNQSGGLPRRATYIESLRAEAEVVPIDVGGAAHGNSPYDLAKFEAILRGEALMGVAAHNIGAAEAKFGPAELRRLAVKIGVPMISANAHDRSGQPVAEPARLVSAAGRRLALVGVLSERYATKELQVSPPRQAAIETLRGLAGKYDAAIVLAYLPDDELRQFADELPEADVVVGGPTGQPISPREVGPGLLCSATSKGKFMVRLDAPTARSGARWSGSIVELDDKFGDDAGQVGNVEAFRRDLGERDFSPGQTGFVEPLPADVPKGYAIAGDKTCKKCHDEDCRELRKTKHAEAWQALKAKGAHVDPECQRCHTTGYGLPGGFASLRRDAALVNVGCESCHGPSRAHVVKSDVHTPYFGRAKDHCTSCHDRENSPKFDYDKYWEKVRHGQKASEGTP